MPTADRTTIKAAASALTTLLQANLAADPPTATQPFRKVEVADAGIEEFPRPFLTLLLAGAKPIGTTSNDKVLSVTMHLRIVTDVAETDPHNALLDKVGAVDDYLDSLIDTGVIEGAEGFDDRVWTFGYPRSAVGARVATAQATQSFVVKVERQQNRVPAP